jgi:hypothetical protein
MRGVIGSTTVPSARVLREREQRICKLTGGCFEEACRTKRSGACTSRDIDSERPVTTTASQAVQHHDTRAEGELPTKADQTRQRHNPLLSPSPDASVCGVGARGPVGEDLTADRHAQPSQADRPALQRYRKRYVGLALHSWVRRSLGCNRLRQRCGHLLRWPTRRHNLPEGVRPRVLQPLGDGKSLAHMGTNHRRSQSARRLQTLGSARLRSLAQNRSPLRAEVREAL